MSAQVPAEVSAEVPAEELDGENQSTPPGGGTCGIVSMESCVDHIGFCGTMCIPIDCTTGGNVEPRLAVTQTLVLDLGTCRCTRYGERKRYVPDCVVLTPGNIEQISWMPATCAYRLIAEGRELYWWHPLVSGSTETVHSAGVSVRGRAISEKRAGDLEDHIVEWPD